MKKIIFTIVIALILSFTGVMADKIDCSQFEKISAKFLECKTINLKGKSKELKLKVTIGAKELKEKINTNAKNGKRKFNKSFLKEKLIKFKNSKH